MNTNQNLTVPAPLFRAGLAKAALSEPEVTPEIPQSRTYSKPEVTKVKTKTSYPFRTKGQIAQQLEADPAFRLQALTILFDRQTAWEKDTSETKDRNRQGFMSSHSVWGTRLAKKHLAGEELTGEELGRVEAITARYTRQLADHFRKAAISENPDLAKVGAVFGV